MTTTLTKLLTAEEFAALPNPVDGSKQELVNGRIIHLPPPKVLHGLVQLMIGHILLNHVKPNQLGWVVTESGTILRRNPDTVRGPDVSFYSKEHFTTLPAGYAETPPSLAVEILSPDDRMPLVRDKIREYIKAGVKLVWLVNPETKTVTVYAGKMRGIEYDETDTLDGGDVLPGFECQIAEMFQ